MLVIWGSDELLKVSTSPHGGFFQKNGDNLLIFRESDLPNSDWQLMRIPVPVADSARVKLKIILADHPQTIPRLFYIGHNNGRDIGFVNITTLECIKAEAISLSATRDGDDVVIEAEYILDDHVVLIGGADVDQRTIYAAEGANLFSIKQFSIDDTLPKGSRPNLTVIDVGAAGGVEPIWLRFANDVKFVLVEPGEDAAKELRKQTADLPDCMILENGLAGFNGVRNLYLTKAAVCSSLLEPDFDALERYSINPIFAVEKIVQVPCSTYESLHQDGAPAPDYIKLDTQGTELEILKGFGDLLNGCSGIFLEAHFYQLYHGQSLIADVVSYLDQFDLRLREVRPCRTFDDDLVEVDCVFTKRIDNNTPDQVREKVLFIEEALQLKHFDLGARIARQFA